MNHKRTAGLLAVVALLGGGAAQAADMAANELGLLLGGGWSDKDLVGSQDSEVNPLIGFRYGHSWGESTNLFGDFTYGKYDGDKVGVGEVKQMAMRAGIEWVIANSDSHNWFLSTALGATRFDAAQADTLTRAMASLGLGQAWEIGANDSLRWEVRAEQLLGGGLPYASKVTQYQALVGYSWGVGAPLDSDGDGVPNRADQCAGTPSGVKVDGNGCPLDSDMDGVFDGLDKCPDTPAGVKVNADGCPLDSDGDGIPDHQDKCPSVPAPNTADGCPPPAPVAEPAPAPAPAPEPAPVAQAPKKRLILKDVFFDFDKATLRQSTIHKLDEVAVSLGDWGEVRIEIAGHTDSTGPADVNLKLSQARAEAVRTYLIGKGIAAERLVAVGYGETKPVASNDTIAGRAENRRVELNEAK